MAKRKSEQRYSIRAYKMKKKFKSLGLGLSATTISIVPSLLPTVSAACTGICGSCGGSCAGLIVAAGASGLIFFNKFYKQKKSTVHLTVKQSKA